MDQNMTFENGQWTKIVLKELHIYIWKYIPPDSRHAKTLLAKQKKVKTLSNPTLSYILFVAFFLSYKRCLVELFGVTIEWCTNPLSFALWLFLYVCFATLHKGAFFHIQWHFSNHFFIKLAWTCSTYKAWVKFHNS